MKDDKTQFTIEHARLIYQTIADIIGEKYNTEICVKVKEKIIKEEHK